MKNLWKGFLRWFRSRWNYVEDAAEEVWMEFEPAAEAILEAGGKAMLSIAYEAVQMAEKPGLSGAEKLTQAKKYVWRSVRDLGRSVGESTINLAIELALAKLKRAVE